MNNPDGDKSHTDTPVVRRMGNTGRALYPA
ncbi:MAG: hypothetical protein JWQ43_1135 [Glaciihabitans sp.]|nr:hypothetical protein [Glaciihabitans sp.]